MYIEQDQDEAEFESFIHVHRVCNISAIISRLKKIIFMTPGVGILVLGHGHVVKMHHFFTSFCLYLGMDQTN